jgi:hypothetical protein
MNFWLSIVLLFALVSSSAWAAPVDGKWTGQTRGRDGQARDVTFTLKASGDQLTGSMTGPGGNDFPISNGKVDGDKVSFTVKLQFGDNSLVMNYKGTVSGDELHCTVSREGSDQSREMTLKRAK